jgi:hypothetical protein
MRRLALLASVFGALTLAACGLVNGLTDGRVNGGAFLWDGCQTHYPCVFSDELCHYETGECLQFDAAPFNCVAGEFLDDKDDGSPMIFDAWAVARDNDSGCWDFGFSYYIGDGEMPLGPEDIDDELGLATDDGPLTDAADVDELVRYGDGDNGEIEGTLCGVDSVDGLAFQMGDVQGDKSNVACATLDF